MYIYGSKHKMQMTSMQDANDKQTGAEISVNIY